MPRSSQRLALARRSRAPVTPTPLAAPSATFLARRAPGWPEVGRRPGRQKVSERRPSTGGAYCKSPTMYCPQLGCRRRVCATGRVVRGCNGEIARSQLLLAPTLREPAPTPGQTMATSPRLSPAGGHHVEPASEAHSRVAQPPSARPSLVAHLLPSPPCCACRLSPAAISRLASRTLLPARGLREAPCGESRFKSGGWAQPQWLR